MKIKIMAVHFGDDDDDDDDGDADADADVNHADTAATDEINVDGCDDDDNDV